MRVVFNTSFDNAVIAMNRAAATLTEAQRQVASGRRMTVPSDDPLGTATAITEHASLQRLDAYTSAADGAASRLGIADSALSDIISQLTAAQSAALAARGSSRTQADRDAASRQLMAIRDALLADINTKFGGEYIFSGSEVLTPAFSESAGTITPYQGNANATRIEIEAGRTVAATFDGQRIFQGSDSQHLLAAITDLAAAVTAGDEAGISAGVDALKRGFDRATAAQTEIGNDLRVVDDGRLRITSARTITIGRLSSVEDADLAEAAARLTQAETAYRASLSSASTLGNTSLMDYLK
jgi:flagellar hook-associated protein 3 FlgL